MKFKCYVETEVKGKKIPHIRLSRPVAMDTELVDILLL